MFEKLYYDATRQLMDYAYFQGQVRGIIRGVNDSLINHKKALEVLKQALQLLESKQKENE